MKKLIYITVFVFLIVACEKEREEVSVQYRVSNALAETEISYQDESGAILKETVNFESGQDIWAKSIILKRGEIVYLSAKYADSASSVKAQILIDGKVYKEKSSNQQPDEYVIVSGTIPY